MALQQVQSDLVAANPTLASFKIRVDGKTQKASVIDVIRMVTGKTSTHSSECLRNLALGRSSSSLDDNIVQLRINGKGRLTPCADAPTCIEIIWELPGKAAKEFRRASAHKICRLLAGDLTLVDEIEKRYVRTTRSAKQFLMQNADAGEALDGSATSRMLKRKAELDIERLELDIAERRSKMRIAEEQVRITGEKVQQDWVRIRLEKKEKGLRCIEAIESGLKKYGMDDRDRLLIQDERRRHLTSGGNESTRVELSIPMVCQEMGVRPKGREGKIGKKLVQLWRAKYNHPRDKKPPKRQSWFQGRSILCNVYYEEDRDIVQRAIRAVVSSTKVIHF